MNINEEEMELDGDEFIDTIKKQNSMGGSHIYKYSKENFEKEYR